MDFIGRDVWGAQYAAGSGARPVPTLEAWLHHAAIATLPVTATLEQECEQMRAVEKIGQQRFGQGFSYNLAGFPSGRLYVGCGVRRVGAHTGGRNTRALGVVMMGNFDKSEVPVPLRAALGGLLRFGHEQGWIDAPRFDGGHKDVPGAATACPGRFGHGIIAAVNAAAAGPAAATMAAALEQGEGGMVIVKEPNGPRQFVCDRSGADHIGGGERAVLVAAGVPYVGDDHPAADRLEFLARRGVSGL